MSNLFGNFSPIWRERISGAKTSLFRARAGGAPSDNAILGNHIWTEYAGMAEIICVIGNKGGTGKTSLSHMLSQGLGLLGHRAASVLTDTAREPLDPAGRSYVTPDARTPESLDRVVAKLRTLENWI